jgi:hypothetical protein
MPGTTTGHREITHVSLTSRDPRQEVDFARTPAAGVRVEFGAARGRSGSFELRSAATRSVAAMRAGCSVPWTAEIDPLDALVLMLVRRGAVRVSGAGKPVAVRTGNAALLPLGVPLVAEANTVELSIVRIASVPAEQAWRDTTDRPFDELRTTDIRRALPAFRNYWWSTVRLISHVLLDGGSSTLSRIIDDEIARTAAVAALLTFFPSGAPDEDGILPAPVRRAMDFIEANAAGSITLADIAAAAGTSPRSLQYAFRRYHGSTPTRYLAGIRRDRAGGGPGPGATPPGVPAAKEQSWNR